VAERRVLPPPWRAAGAAALLALAACSTPPAADGPAALLAALNGTWSNQRQFDAAPAALKVPPSPTGEWLDHQHAVFARVHAPALGEQVLYLEWRSGGATGPVSRQRIWSFRRDAEGSLRMDFHAFVDGTPWVGKAQVAGAFETLTPAALRSYGPDCALRFVPRGAGAWRGAITSAQCTLTAASGRRMGIDAVVELDAQGLRYRETGTLADGRPAFRVPPLEPYRFERVLPP